MYPNDGRGAIGMGATKMYFVLAAEPVNIATSLCLDHRKARPRLF